MIVKLFPGTNRAYTGGLRTTLRDNEAQWLKCVEFSRGGVVVEIEDQKLNISARYIDKVINEERQNFVDCNACGKVQPIGAEKCINCGRRASDGYLKPLLVILHNRGIEEVLKESVGNAFSI